jgi:zinc transport system substrate-binding protein
MAVVASFYPVEEVAKRVGGQRVRVENLTPPGVEPHDLELSPRQVDRLEDADLVLYLGHGFQPAVAEVAERRGSDAVDLLDHIKLQKAAAEEGGEEEHHGQEPHDSPAPGGGEGTGNGLDPHFWLNPQLMVQASDVVAAELSNRSPEDADAFRRNAERYKEELLALDRELERRLSSCDRKEIVTSHAAFFYLAERYGLTQIPIAGLSPEAEPDAARLAEVSDRIESRGITTVFFEDLVSPNVAEALARDAGVETAVLSPIEGLTREQLDAGKDYAAVMRGNLAALSVALGCR